MSSNRYGYMAKIGIDTTGVQNGLNEADSAMRAFSREMREVNNVIRQGGDTAEMAAQRNQIYTGQIEQLNRRLEALRSVEESINRARANDDIDEGEYRAYRREIEQTEASIRRLTEEQNNLNDSTRNATDSTSRFGDVLRANIATKALEALVDILKKAAGAMKDYALEGIQLASDLVEKQNVVDVTFGDDSNKIYEFADTAAEKFGLTKLAAEQYAGTMGALFKSSGITQGIDDMSIKMAQLAADMASFYNISSDMAFEKLRSGISGESEPLKALGINLSVANLEAYALSEGINTAWKNMSQAEQTMLRYNYILSQTADAQGDFERTSDSLANQQRIMQLNLQKVQTEIGEKLLPVAQEMLGLVNDHMPEIEGAANYLADEMIPVIKELADDAKEFVENGGLEDVINVLKWVVEHGDEIITVLAVMWGTEKLQGFTAQLSGVPQMLTNVINGFGNLSQTMMGPASTAFSNFGSTASASMSSVTTAVQGLGSTSALAFAGIATAAIAAVGSLIILSDELNTIADGMTNLTAETKKSDENVKDMSERWGKISDLTGLDKYKEASAMLDDVIASEREWNSRYKKTIDELNVLQEKKFKTADETARMKELQNQKESLDAEYSSLQLYHNRLTNELNKYDEQTVANLERSAEEQARAQANAGKTNEQAVAEAWEKIRETTKAEMDKYDSELATHKIDDTEYWEKRKAYLEAHRDEESEEWWKYYDEVTEHYKKLSETEKKAADKSLENTYSERYESLKRTQKEKGYNDQWLADELKKMIGDMETGTDLYYTYYDKWLDLTDKISDTTQKAAEKEVKEWQSSADKVSNAVKKKYEKVQTEFEKAKSSYISALDLSASEKAEDDVYSRLGLARPKNGEESADSQYDFSSDTIAKQTKELDEYTRNMERLEKSDIPEEYLENIRSMSFDKRKEYVKELLKLSPERLKKHYADISKYYKSAEKAGVSDTKTLREEADKAAEEAQISIQSSLEKLTPNAYESGKVAAEAYWKGFAEYQAQTDKLLGITGAEASGNAARQSNASGSFISTNTPLSISLNIDGKQFASAVNITINDFFKAVRNGGGMLNV